MTKNSQTAQLTPSTFIKCAVHLLLIVLNGQLLASPIAERPPTEFIVQMELGINRAEEVGANVGQIARRLETICAMAFWRAMKAHLFGRGPIGSNRNGAGREETKSVAVWDNEGEKGAVTLFPFRVQVIGLSSPQAPSAFHRPFRLFFSASLNGQMIPAKSLFADLSLLSLSEVSALLRIPTVGIFALVQMELAEHGQWWVIALIAGGGLLLIGCGWMLLVLYFNLCTVSAAAIPTKTMDERNGEKEKRKEKMEGRREEEERQRKEEEEKEEKEEKQQQKSTVRSKSWRRRGKKMPKLRKMVGVLRRKTAGERRKNEEKEEEAEEEERRTDEEGKRGAAAEEEGVTEAKERLFPKMGGQRQKVKELEERRPISSKSVNIRPKLAILNNETVANGRTAPPNRLRPYWVADQLESIYHLFHSPSTHPRPGPEAKDGEIRAEIIER